MKGTWGLVVMLILSATAATEDAITRPMLAAHNAERARAGVPPLAWSEHLASVAKEWAGSLLESGKFSHRTNSSYGENIFDIRGGKATAAQVVESWTDEEKDYDLAKNTCRAGAVCGHYTQVVWRNTKQVGCAVARDSRREVWVCNYDPPGNWQGQRPF